MGDGEAAMVVGLLAAAFREQITKETVATWVEQLRPMRYEAAIGAAQRIMREEDRMPSLHSLIEATQAAARELASERAGPCGECDGNGFVVVDEARPGTVRPCSSCRIVEYRRWDGGHFMPDHDCVECREYARTSNRKRKGS